MTELSVSDWPRCVAWYRDALGLPVELLDEARRFALLGGEGGRLALKEGRGTAEVRLSFEVCELDAVRADLERRGADPGPIVDDANEGFRSFRVTDPGGVVVQVFSWGHSL